MSEQLTLSKVPRTVAWVLTVGGLIGLAASFELSWDKVRLLQDPNYVPGCTVGQNFSCGTVMQSSQASVFGFPNSFLGVIGFSIVMTLGVVLLTGWQPARWIWWGLQVGALLAVASVHWLMVQSLYEIGALCLYCMAVWTVTIPIFWYVSVTNVINDPGRLAGLDEDEEPRLPRLHWVVPVIWLVIIAVLITLRFA